MSKCFSEESSVVVDKLCDLERWVGEEGADETLWNGVKRLLYVVAVVFDAAVVDSEGTLLDKNDMLLVISSTFKMSAIIDCCNWWLWCCGCNTFAGIRSISIAFIGVIKWWACRPLFDKGLLQYDIEESEDTTVTEDADFSLILNGAELEFASYTYASEEGWLELLVVLLVDVSDFVDEGDAVVLFNVLVEALFVMIVSFAVLELEFIAVSVVDELGRNLAIWHVFRIKLTLIYFEVV